MNPLFQIQNAMQQVQRLAQQFQNPQMMVQKIFPNAPAEVRNDPGQLLNWLQQTGTVTQEQIQWARQMLGR